jgi:hypothetical protein
MLARIHDAAGQQVIGVGMTLVQRNNEAQYLCNELFAAVESSLSDAWISDDAYTDSPEEYLQIVRGALAALDEARAIMKKFLRKHERKLAVAAQTGD